MRILKRSKVTGALIGLILVLCLAGCQESPPMDKYYDIEAIKMLLNSDEMISEPLLEDIELDKYPAEDFLYDNHCFSFYRDMDYFLSRAARYDYTNLIINEYPPQAVRIIDNNGQKSMYFVYETDDATRVFIFFFEGDSFQYTRGFPIIMKKTLNLEAFTTLEVGNSIDDVELIDPIASLYKKGYDTLSDEMIQQLYIEGPENISTLHLLSDGIVKINYCRTEDGNYIISKIISSKDFTISVLGGKLCYLIYSSDYI